MILCSLLITSSHHLLLMLHSTCGLLIDSSTLYMLYAAHCTLTASHRVLSIEPDFFLLLEELRGIQCCCLFCYCIADCNSLPLYRSCYVVPGQQCAQDYPLFLLMLIATSLQTKKHNTTLRVWSVDWIV